MYTFYLLALRSLLVELLCEYLLIKYALLTTGLFLSTPVLFDFFLFDFFLFAFFLFAFFVQDFLLFLLLCPFLGPWLASLTFKFSCICEPSDFSCETATFFALDNSMTLSKRMWYNNHY